MKRRLVLPVIFLAVCAWSPAHAVSDVDFGISIGSEGIRDFYLSVGNYYRVPVQEVSVVHERGIPYDEVPVVFFIAKRARVAPHVIMDLRLRGMSWWDISLRYGVGPDIYYVPTTVVIRDPYYSHAYGLYRKYPRSQWKRKIVLRDADIVHLVNLRYVSERYGYAPSRVIRMRERGDHFVVIDRSVDREMKGKRRYVHGERKYVQPRRPAPKHQVKPAPKHYDPYHDGRDDRYREALREKERQEQIRKDRERDKDGKHADPRGSAMSGDGGQGAGKGHGRDKDPKDFTPKGHGGEKDGKDDGGHGRGK